MSPQDSDETGTPPMPSGHDDSSDVDKEAERSASAIADSLGEALVGMSLGGPPTSSNYGSSAIAGAPFSLASGMAPSTGDDDGWGNYKKERTVFAGPGAAPSSPTRRDMGNESLNLFLSQSPSQTLGDDVFKLSHPNLPSLEEDQQRLATGNYRLPAVHGLTTASTSLNGYGGNTNGNVNQESARKGSPSNSVSGTGTTAGTSSSRSVSPYTSNNAQGGDPGRTIQAFHRYDSGPTAVEASRSNSQGFGATEDDRSSSGFLSNGHGSNPSLVSMESSNYRSPYGKDRGVKSASPYDPDRTFAPQQPVFEPSMGNTALQAQMPNGAQQSQVLYMAVPSADGRGQVLQPVQMMQMPGKPYAFVMPGAGGANQPVLAADNSHGSLVLPPMNGAAGGKEYSMGVDASTRMASYAVDTNLSYGPPARMDSNSSKSVSRSTSGQFPTDPAVTSLYATPQRPPLDSLLGQVRRLSRDQVGCRLVQQALDEEGPMAATLILNEGLPFWGEAMVDPFGNYLFQKILEKVTAEERIMLVKSVSPRLVNASLNLHGTRSVQKVVELCAQDELEGAKTRQAGEESSADILVKSLSPAAARLCIDSHGNHVIQRILLKLGHNHAKFVFDAVANGVGDVARHRHGCCVIQRCLDSAPSQARSHLVLRIVEKSLELMQDAYGNYVVQYVLDVCSDEDVQAVCESVVGKVNLLAIQKFSSNVMEKCLERCSDRTKELYLQEMSDPNRVRELMMDPFGNYVVQRALSVATHTQAVCLVEAMRPHLVATQTTGPNGQRNGGVRNTAGGRRIIAKICRRFPNFTLNPIGTQAELYSQNKVSNHNRHQHQHQHSTHQSVLQQQQVQQQHQHHHHLQQQQQVQQQQQQVQASMYYGGAVQPSLYTDPRLNQGHLAVQQPQQGYYNVAGTGGAGGGGNAYYDPFNGHTGYPGM